MRQIIIAALLILALAGQAHAGFDDWSHWEFSWSNIAPPVIMTGGYTGYTTSDNYIYETADNYIYLPAGP